MKVSFSCRAAVTITFGIACFATSTPMFGQTATTDTPYSVVDRGPYYNVLQRTVSVTNSLTGEVSEQVQGYTELGDGMNYLSNGVWSTAQDLIEITPNGAQAVHGQMTANFSSDITSTGAISLTSSAGEVFQSHPIGLFYADSASGKLAQIASVQSSVGTLYPPNVIVFSNVLAGLSADLMLVWAKNGYEQNLVLKHNPPPPSSFSMSINSTTLQFWSAMDTCPIPQEQRPVLLDSGLEDHILIFTNAWFPVGGAFAFGNTALPPAGEAAQIRLLRPSEPGTVPVAKSLVSIAGQQVLIEEVKYTDLASALNRLPTASLSPKPNQTVELAQRESFLKATSKAKRADWRPMQVASTQYSPNGVVLDYMELPSSANTFTFTNSQTYHIHTSFSVGPGTAYFQQNACIKSDTNAYLLVYGPVSCSTSGLPTVLTSSDDNGYGATIGTSTANPGYAAQEEIWMYFQTVTTTLQNLLVRWAQTDIRYDENANLFLSPQMTSVSLQDSTTGVYYNLGSDTLTISQVTSCNVTTPKYKQGGSLSGTVATDCGVVSVAMVNDPIKDATGLDTNKNSQSECSFAVLDATNIVAAFMDTHLSEYGLGDTANAFPGITSPRTTQWTVSTNSGSTFTNQTPLPPYSQGTSPNPTQGDAGDPSMVYDSGSNVVYLLTNPSRETGFQGFRLWTSSDKGKTFNLVNTNVPSSSSVSNVDGARLKLDLFKHYLYVAGTGSAQGTWLGRSTNGGNSWDLIQFVDSHGGSGDFAIEPNGTVYVFWLSQIINGSYHTNTIKYSWLLPNQTVWHTATTYQAHSDSTILYSLNLNGGGPLLRSNNATSGDYLDDNGVPRVAINPVNGRVYVVYADLPFLNSTVDHGDIYINEATTNSDGSLTWTGVRKVNNDRTQTDQWNPSIAVNPSGTKLFVGYYSRQNDPNNSTAMAYGANANIANGLATATFDCVPISPTAFKLLFPGTTAPAAGGWAYDPVWPQTDVCLNTNAVYDGTGCNENPFACNSGVVEGCTDNHVIHFCADDYTWVDADGSYFYFAWCDRSRTFYSGSNSRPDADVKLAKIKQ